MSKLKSGSQTFEDYLIRKNDIRIKCGLKPLDSNDIIYSKKFEEWLRSRNEGIGHEFRLGTYFKVGNEKPIYGDECYKIIKERKIEFEKTFPIS